MLDHSRMDVGSTAVEMLDQFKTKQVWAELGQAQPKLETPLVEYYQYIKKDIQPNAFDRKAKQVKWVKRAYWSTG